MNWYVQIGFVATAAVAVFLALFFRSAVDLWHDVGSVGVPALLVPLGASYLKRRWRMRPRVAAWSIAVSGLVSFAWLLTGRLPGSAGYFLSLEPIYAGLLVSGVFWACGVEGTQYDSRSHADGAEGAKASLDH